MTKDYRDIICTIGTTSFNEETLDYLQHGSDFFRINLSHTPKDKIEFMINELQKYRSLLMIDTEGSQIRTGNSEKIEFIEGENIRIYPEEVTCNRNNMFFRPLENQKFQEGQRVHMDFNSTIFVIDKKNPEGTYDGRILDGGVVRPRKGVHIEKNSLTLPFLSTKDRYAISLAKTKGVKNFSLSFVRTPEDIKEFTDLYPQADFLAKIETADAVKNLEKILKISKGILIDRGDLGREIPVQKIPFLQKDIIRRARELQKKVYVATSTLEEMSYSLQPSVAEVNDIVNILYDGASGIVLTKETAIGKHPVTTLNMLKMIIEEFESRR